MKKEIENWVERQALAIEVSVMTPVWPFTWTAGLRTRDPSSGVGGDFPPTLLSV